MKKYIFIFLIIISYIIYCQNYTLNINKCVNHVNTHALSKSHTCCAWFVMRALHSGGCFLPIAPAWAYKYILPVYKFKTVKDKIQYGDIIVFPAIKNHPYGHIAIWNGKQWVSDFKQKSIFPAKGYQKSNYII